jgi:catechol 2,3-dioxygenase-like lactoylglutathione lyase family enzyme
VASRESGISGSDPRLTVLDHLVIGVRDLAAASATYAALLGRDPSWRGVHAGWGTANTLFRLDNTDLELLSPAGEGLVGDALRAHLETHGEGPYALAFATDDAEACAAGLRARGMPALDPVEGSGHDSASGAERRWRNVLLPTTETRSVRLFATERGLPADRFPFAPATAEAAAVVTGVDHVVIMTPEPEAAIGLYRDRLRLRLAFDRTFEERGVRLVFFRIGGITVELAAPLGATAGGDRFWGISYRVRDAGAARARVTASGFDVSAVRPGHKPGTRVCTVRRETHGVATLLIEVAGRHGTS